MQSPRRTAETEMRTCIIPDRKSFLNSTIHDVSETQTAHTEDFSALSPGASNLNWMELEMI